MSFNLPRNLLRKIWRQSHVFLALAVGLLFVLQGITGSFSVYREELDKLFNPELHVEAKANQFLPLDTILAEIRKAHPDRHGSWVLEMPVSPDGALTAWFEKPRESVDLWYAPLMVAVDPYTGRVLANRFWGQTLTTWVADWHSHWLLDAAGRVWVARLAVLLMLSVLSGLCLWWPGRGNLLKALRLRHDAGLMRLLMDSHRLLGLTSAVLLLLLAFTGFHLANPALLEAWTGAGGMGHGDAGPNVRSTAVPNGRPISVEEAVLVARGLFPSSELRRVTTPAGELGTYKVNLRQRRELNQRHSFTTVWIDRWSGQIRAVNNPILYTPGQTFTTWQWPLHTGEAFGSGGRLLWFLLGFVPLLLWTSGVAHWLYRHGYLQDKAVRPGLWARALPAKLLNAGKNLIPLLLTWWNGCKYLTRWAVASGARRFRVFAAQCRERLNRGE